MTADERRAVGAATMAARRRRVQADRKVDGAILRGAVGLRPMAAARAEHQADVRHAEASERDAVGNHQGAADLVAAAERLRRAAAILGGGRT